MTDNYRPLPAIAMALVCTLLIAAAPADDQPSVLVQMTTVKKGAMPKTVTAYGTAQADPSARTTLTAPLAAVVANVYVRPGEKVAKGARLLRLVPDPQTSASYRQAVTALENATALVAHTQELYKQYLATGQDLANAKKAQADARAALTALKAQGAQGAKTLTARMSAIVTNLSVSAGSKVDIGTPLLDLAPPGNLVLRVGVVPDQAAAIKSGDMAQIVPVGGTESVDGKVMLSGSMVEAGNGLVPIDIAVPEGALLPGQTAEATITTGTVDGYIVPHAAVLVDDAGKPYVVQAVQMKAKIVPVRVLGMNGNQDVVDGALDARAPLILAGNYQLQEGMAVRLADTPAQTP